MNAKTLSGLTAIAIAAASLSLAACNQRSPGTDSMSRSSPATTDNSSATTTSPPSSTADASKAPSSSMNPAPSTGMNTGTSSPSQTTAPMSGDTTSAQTGDTAKKAAGGADDASLMAQVKSALQSEPSLRAQSIEVDSKNATVTLSGSVDSAASKAKANEIAAGVNGVAAVVDHLTIKAS